MSSSRYTCIPLDAPAEWDEALARIPHAFAHTWVNCRAMSAATGNPTFLYVAEIGDLRCVCPIAERTFESCIDIYTPYGFSGFVGTGVHPAFADCWADFVGRKGYVCGYFRLNPVLDTARYFDGACVTEDRTVYVLDLTATIDELFQRLDSNRRRQLRNLDPANPTVVTDRALLQEFFLSTYAQFYRSRGSGLLEQLRPDGLSRLLAADSVFLIGIAPRGSLEAVSVFGYTPYAGEYLFNVSVPGGESHSAALVWLGMLHLRSLGIPLINLGGGIRENDGVARFKERFGATRLPLRWAGQIYRPDVYERLCQTVPGAGVGGKAGEYFPRYRLRQ